jgi:predicted ester cyclase
MKHLLFICVCLLAISCSQPYAKVDINDEKSIIINKIFEEVSAERIDYLNEVFSDDMKMVNSKEVSFNKKEFIAGIEEMFDLFEDITFESVDGDANGSEIETNHYSNGKIWSSIWNNFSATGKYTGQKVKFPFHISYQWENDKIIEEFQFFDMYHFEKEANAKSSKNLTNEKVGFILELSVNKGYTLANVKALLEDLTTFMRKNEPDAYDYGYYISQNSKKITLIEKYKNSEAAILHADNFENGPNMKPFLDTFTINSFILIGNSSEELKNRIKAYGVEPRVLAGGWTN